MATLTRTAATASFGRTQLLMAIVLTAFAALVFSLYGLDLPLRRDNAQYIYSAQRLLHGEMPYQSLFDMKTPLTSFITAGVLFISQHLFGDPLRGVRLFYMALCLATIALTFLFARRLLRGGEETWLAPLFMLGFHGYLLQSAISAEPKLVVLFLMMIGLHLLVSKKWLALGAIASLCSFTWQPSGTIFIASLVFAALQDRHMRVPALLRLVGGFLLPSIVIFGVFWLTGAFRDLLQGAMILHFYLSRPDENEVLIISRMLPFGFPFAFPLIIASLIAFLVYALRTIMLRGNTSIGDLPHLPLLIMMVIFAIGSLLDFQSYPDFFVFLPFAALGIVVLYRAIRQWLVERNASEGMLQAYRYVCLAVLFAIPLLNAAFANIFSDHAAISRGALSEQKQAYDTIIRNAIGSYDANTRIIVIGVPEIPALLQLRNATQHVSLGSVNGYDEFIASNYPTGLRGWLDEMSAGKPSLVVVKISDLSGYTDANRQLFVEWLNRNFRHLSDNPGVSSPRFRSEKIETWISLNGAQS
jgi:hypothetical protein